MVRLLGTLIESTHVAKVRQVVEVGSDARGLPARGITVSKQSWYGGAEHYNEQTIKGEKI